MLRVYTPSGDLAFKEFDFSDNQPHFKLETIDDSGFTTATVETAIASPRDLIMVAMVASVLRAQGYSTLNLDVRYLLGARMDRALSGQEPFTLDIIARVINSCGFSRVRILDVHSEVATKLIRNSLNVLPHRVLETARASSGFPFLVCPDKGAIPRVRELAHGNDVIYCAKHRVEATGELTGFSVDKEIAIRCFVDHPECLIVDDICDGGGTFVGLAKELRKAGAKKVFLYVTHGIFSKGWPLEGIDKCFTTDSLPQDKRVWDKAGFVVIPISLKEL